MVSIIIVNYKVEKELIACISSILKSEPKVSYEIIVVDNDEKKTIEKRLRNKFPQVKYMKSSKNIGYGAGNNLGAKFAKGDFLFFLNPDTTVSKDSIDILYTFMKKNHNAGMVAPLLFDPEDNVYPYQGSNAFNLISAIVVLSFFNKLFRSNIISSKFFHKKWNKRDVEEFDVVPGTAFMIRKSIFQKAGMFDEEFFLYFEEYDLAIRIKKMGYKNYIIPKAKVLHIWEASTKKRRDISRIFSQSRYYFFKKNYGRLFAFIVSLFSNLGKHELFLGFIIILTMFLGLFRIRELMPFIGDQGWYYLSARDILIYGQIPLVGIASSHPWLHQGPFWTYLLTPFLRLFNFDPVSGAYLTIILGALSIVGIYIVGSALFGKRVGIIASLLYATSPLAVYYMRFPYHTSPIPLLTIILTFSLYKITQNKFGYLPLTIFLMSVLYNFEIATVVLWGSLVSILMYKFLKERKNFRQIFNKKIIFFSLFSFLTPLLPIILYDVRNGFPHTLKFAAWSIYRAVSLFGYNSNQAFSMNKIIIMFNFLFDNFRKLIFAQSNLISFLILVALVGWAIYMLTKREKTGSYNLIFFLLLVPFIFIVLNQTPSDAYLLLFFPIVILIFSSFLDFLMNKKIIFFPVFIFILILTIGNIHFMLRNDFSFYKSSKLFTLDKRIQTSRWILNIAQNKDYNLKGKGPGSEYQSFTMNYEYLSWWLGQGPSKTNEKLKIYISESEKGIKIDNSK